jgi:hypothetical protein
MKNSKQHQNSSHSTHQKQKRAFITEKYSVNCIQIVITLQLTCGYQNGAAILQIHQRDI